MNDDIRISEVRLIDDTGEQVGVVPTAEALAAAREVGLDLVEVSPNASPPVAKILDFGKFKYQQNRKNTGGKKKQRAGMVKAMRFRPRTADHDLNFKVKRLEKFLVDGNKVRAFVQLRARERFHPENGIKVLERVKTLLAEFGVVERDITREQDGRVISVIMAPSGRS